MVKSKKRKKSKKKLLIALLLTFLVLAASAAAVSNITITEMSVEGNKHYTKEEIRDILFGTAKERNTLYCFLNQKFGEPKDIPFVDRYDFEFSGLNRVDVIIYEKSVVGYIEYMGSYMYFDRDGIIVESSSKPTAGIPLVTGLDFDRIVLYRELPVKKKEVFDEILTLTQLFTKYDLKVDKVYFDSSLNVVLYIGEIRVRMGSNTLLEGKVAELHDMLPHIQDKGPGTLYLDVYSESAIDRNYVFEKDGN